MMAASAFSWQPAGNPPPPTASTTHMCAPKEVPLADYRCSTSGQCCQGISPVWLQTPDGIALSCSSHPKIPNTSGPHKVWEIFLPFQIASHTYLSSGTVAWQRLDVLSVGGQPEPSLGLRSYLLENLWCSPIVHPSSHLNIQVKLLSWVKRLEFLWFRLSLLLELFNKLFKLTVFIFLPVKWGKCMN